MNKQKYIKMSRDELDLAYQYACRMREIAIFPKDRLLWDRQIEKIEGLLEDS